jgi:phenylacetate-CoA ligase
MSSPLTNELRFATRAILRDNFVGLGLLRALQEQERSGAQQLARRQATLLYRSLRSALARLPFYADMPRDFSAAEAADALRCFPIITKQTLLANRSSLFPNGGVKQPWHIEGMTSGTTGTPLTVFRSLQSLLMEQAFMKRHWGWAGFHDGMARASLRGDMVIDIAQQAPPFWFWNRYNRQLLLSSRHLTEAHADAIIERLASLAPSMLQAYPSTAFTLAGMLRARGRRLAIPFVFTASEPLYPHQRALILDWLGCKVMDMYGMAERVALATECEHGALHVNSDYSYVEIVDDDGQPTRGEGYIVGTTFHNHAMPLVRYRLSDRARWRPGQCQCGRPFPILEGVSGKFEDSIFGSSGAPVSASVLTFAFKGLEYIAKSQVAQVGAACWQVRVVPLPGFGAAHRLQLIENIHRLVDPGVHVEVVLCDALPNTAGGKFRWVVNEWRAGTPPT